MTRVVDIATVGIQIKDTSKLTFELEVPLTAVYRGAFMGLAQHQLLQGTKQAQAFPVIVLHFEFDPTVTLTEKRLYLMVPRGNPQELPDGAEYVTLLNEPNVQQPGQPPNPILLFEIPNKKVALS